MRIHARAVYAMPDAAKGESELKHSPSPGYSFPKIVVRKDIGRLWYGEMGALHTGLIEFLVNENVILKRNM